MATQSRRILDRQTLVTGDAMDLTEATDLAEYSTLEIVITVHTADTPEAGASAAELVVRHAPVAEEDGWLDFETAVTVDLSVAGKTWRHVSSFTRFLGWSVSGSLGSSAVVTLDVVAKD